MMRPAWTSERRRRLLLNQQYQTAPERTEEEPADVTCVPESEMPSPPASGPAISLKILGLAEQPRQVSVSRPYLVLGRKASCDVRLEHESVSPRHAYFQWIAGRILLIDLESATGTRWNGTPRFCDWVGDGDCISIGPYLLGLSNQQPAADSETSANGLIRGVAPFSLSSYVLRPLTDAARQASAQPLKFGGAVTLIGSHPRCAIRVAHPSVAEFHCSLIQSPHGLQIVDLLSGRRTAVNGELVRSAHLEQGNELQIGEILFRVMFDEVVPDRDDVTQWTVPASVVAAGESPASDIAALSTPDRTRPNAVPPSTGMLRPASHVNGREAREPAESHLVTRSAYNLAALETLQGAASVLTTLETRLSDLSQQMAAVQHEIEKLREQIAPVQSVAAELQEFMQRLKWSLEEPQPMMPLPQRPRRRKVPQFKSSMARRSLTAQRGDDRTTPPANVESQQDASGSTDIDAHVWLFNRIARIHRERNSRWRQVFDLFT